MVVCLLLVSCSGWYGFYVMAVGCVLFGVFISVNGELVPEVGSKRCVRGDFSVAFCQVSYLLLVD